MMIVEITRIFSEKKWKKWLMYVFMFLTFVSFLGHAWGLGARWYISGHAPWSNAYEAMVYVSWVVILAGFLLSRYSKLVLAATTIFAGAMLMVAHLNWLNPEITPLVPVLKSYWLTIHVAVMTGSYAFLGLGAILSIINLIIMSFKFPKNYRLLDVKIEELTRINEVTLIIGVFMATIGTFLGGIWANESWGRYWGWDPKETWALIIVLVYAIILHLRFIPKCNGKYLFNLVSLIGFGSVLMTFFGVNYYLSGLHSYAGGTPPPMPAFVMPTLVIIGVIAVVAYIRNKASKNWK